MVLLLGIFEEDMPATLGEDDEVSDPSMDVDRPFSFDRARAWAAGPRLNPLLVAVDTGGDDIGATPGGVKREWEERCTYD